MGGAFDHPSLDDDARALVGRLREAPWQAPDPEGDSGERGRSSFSQGGWERFAALGLCGLPAPVAFGGGGAGRVATAAALEALGHGCPDSGLVFSLSAHLWSAVVPIWQYGDGEQQRRYLPQLCSGEWIGLHAVTEPATGSDAFALATVAEPDGDGYRISGTKALITNAPVARLFVIFARAPRTSGPLGISAFIIDSGAPGVSVGAPLEKAGLWSSPMAMITLDDVAVGPDARLGPEGRGSLIFTTSMEWERSLIMAAQLGVLTRSIEEAAAWLREADPTPPDLEQATAELVDVKVQVAAARALLYENAWALDRGEQTGAGGPAAVKLLAAETTLGGALKIVDVVGRRGASEDLPFAGRLRDALGGPLYSGTSQMMRRMVARDMGL